MLHGREGGKFNDVVGKVGEEGVEFVKANELELGLIQTRGYSQTQDLEMTGVDFVSLFLDPEIDEKEYCEDYEDEERKDEQDLVGGEQEAVFESDFPSQKKQRDNDGQKDQGTNND